MLPVLRELHDRGPIGQIYSCLHLFFQANRKRERKGTLRRILVVIPSCSSIINDSYQGNPMKH